MDVYKNIENVCIRSMRQEDLDEVIAMESLFLVHIQTLQLIRKHV